MRRIAVLALFLLPAFAGSFSLETGYQIAPKAGSYTLLRYNIPVALLNTAEPTYVWLLPEIGLLPDGWYLRTQALAETDKYTWMVDLKYDGTDLVFRIGVRTEFGVSDEGVRTSTQVDTDSR